MSDYTEAEKLHAAINRLVAVEKTLEEEFWALPEGSAYNLKRMITILGVGPLLQSNPGLRSWISAAPAIT